MSDSFSLEQAIEILEHFQQEGAIHPEYAANRKQAIEDLRSDLSYVLTGTFHRQELEMSVGRAGKQISRERKRES